MQLDIYQIDAFADKTFEGNPAAVVPLEKWLPDATLQAIAEENNLAETAYFIPTEDGFYIRWFTPTSEVALCGHATLASAFVLFEELGHDTDVIHFQSLSGPLSVTKRANLLSLNFPAQNASPCSTPDALVAGLSKEPVACYGGEDYLAVFETEDDIRQLKPNFQALGLLDRRGVIATAPASKWDFVVRFFAPNFGIPEDSVTGSAYTQLAPYWSERLGKNTLQARQLSKRGGNVQCELAGDRVYISGGAVKYLEGRIEVDLG